MTELLNKIHNCDNAEILAQLPDKSLDFILEDMPYANTDLEWDKPVDLEKYWNLRLSKIKENGAIALTGQQPFITDLISSNREMCRYEIIYEKTNGAGFLNARKMPLRAHENILVFYKKLPVYNPQKTKANNGKIGRTRLNTVGRTFGGYSEFRKDDYKYTDDGYRYPRSVIKFSNFNGALFGNTEKTVIHPTQKPIELFSWLIRTYTNEGDLVFDGFGGSGTTALSCLREKRNFIVCEWNKDYFEQANLRINDELKRQPLLVQAA